jgi:hypothetical protein
MKGETRVTSKKTSDVLRPQLRRAATLATVAGLIAAGGLGLSAPALSIPVAVAPSTVYVSPGGIDSPTCGGVDQKCLTIQHGIDQANGGDTVQVSAGTYPEVVTIAKGVNLQGAGADVTIIDGTDVPPGPTGLLDIGTANGDVTVSGFTIENPGIGTVAGPYTITVQDSNPADHITISDNTILGTEADPDFLTNAPLGIDSADTFASMTVTNNDISGVWQGVLLEGLRGALNVSGNHIHGLTPYDDGTNKFPAEGVYVLSDKQSSASDQNVTDNIFDGYNGIGIAYSAGYDLGGCTDVPCEGTVTGSITGNTFDLAANAPDFATASAIRLRAINAGDELNLTMGGNTGTVAAPTKTIEETPNAGSITITPTSTPDAIIPSPTPTVDLVAPSPVTTGAPAVSFESSATNPVGGDDIAHARYDISLTGTSGLTASEITLQYETTPGNFATVALEGSASSGDAITGSVGPLGGFEFPASPDPLVTNFKISVPSADAATGPITSTVNLDEVSSGTGNPVINTLASDTQTIDVVASTPTIANHSDATQSGKPVTVAVPDAVGEHGPFTYTHGAATHGTVTGSAQALVYTPAATFVGTDHFTYTATDTNDAPATGTETVTVTRAATSLSASISPARPTSADTVSVKVTVTTTGDPTGATVGIKSGTTIYTGKVVHKTVTIRLHRYSGGQHPIAITFPGTASTLPSTASMRFTVAKVKSTLALSTNPRSITNKTTSSKATVTVVSTGASTTGATIVIKIGSRVLGSGTVHGGKAVITLPHFPSGTKKLTVSYSGTATSAATTRTFTIVVKRG